MFWLFLFVNNKKHPAIMKWAKTFTVAFFFLFVFLDQYHFMKSSVLVNFVHG